MTFFKMFSATSLKIPPMMLVSPDNPDSEQK